MKNSLTYKIYRTKTITRIETKIKLLGSSNTFSLSSYLNTRLILSLIIFIGSFSIFKFGYIIAPILTIVFYLLFEKVVFDYPIKKRGLQLEQEAIFFLEVLVLTLENGRSLKQALELTTANIDSTISYEFKQALEEVELGKSFAESLNSLKKRIPSDTINTIILAMIEAHTFGNSIISTLYSQVEFLREKHLLDIKSRISKLPTKISIVSVLFFIPIMLLLILSPVLIKFLVKG